MNLGWKGLSQMDDESFRFLDMCCPGDALTVVSPGFLGRAQTIKSSHEEY